MSAQDLLLSAYDYELPEELIAQHPADRRDHSRLLTYQRSQQHISHHWFYELPSLLTPGDLLVLNNTRVFPARLFGVKVETGTRFQFLLSRPVADLQWWAIGKNTKRMRAGMAFDFPEGVTAEIQEIAEGGNVRMVFSGIEAQAFSAWLERHGEIPYPPYITARDTAAERYQTVFSQHTGSVAAPTAGLHFTADLLTQLKNQGIDSVSLTLHVGIGTFSPVRTEDITAHELHGEHYEMEAATAERLNAQRAAGKRIIAVGTTATRTLETLWRKHGQFQAERGETKLFVYPGQTLGSIDGLITNFHLPKSSLLMLVSTLIGREPLMHLYAQAIAERYRFFSFGDAMLILP
jgi:S-adenosylmethionine:tRNA ribosyltransferase-isomerase